MKTPVLKIKDMAGQTGKIPVVKVAKAEQNLRTADDTDMALNSLLFLPKVYAVAKPELFVPSGGISEQYRYIHGLGYPPMYLYLHAHDYLMGFSEYTAFDPERYTYSLSGGFASMDSTQFLDIGGGDGNAYLVLFLDSLATLEKDYSIDSRFQSLKVHMQGQFVINLPSFNATAYSNTGWYQIDWFSFNHNLGYPPVFSPFVDVFGVNVVQGFQGEVPTDFILNDVNDSWAESYVYSIEDAWKYPEVFWIYVDNNKYYVGCKRDNWDEASHTFPARTVKVNYTIFNLPINEEFNLLS